MLKKAIILSFALALVVGVSSLLGQGKISAAAADTGYGGSGGAITTVSYCTNVVYGDWKVCSNGWQYRDVTGQSPTGCTLSPSQQSVRSMACGSTPTGTVTPTTPTASVDTITSESGMVSAGNLQTLLTDLHVSANSSAEAASLVKYKAVLGQDSKITAADKTIINDFIVYGTPSTLQLGAGERAGVVNSFFQAFGKLPTTPADWSDAIKIANGRWTSATSAASEAAAKVQFKKVYGRAPVMTNSKDENAVMVMAYGLIPSQRKLSSETAATNTFRYYYGYTPVSAAAWNIVRAIAYSGATR